MRTKRRTVFDIISVILFVMISLIMLIPIYKVLVDSFDLKTAYGMRLLPQQFGLDGYISVFTNPTLFQPFLISCDYHCGNLRRTCHFHTGRLCADPVEDAGTQAAGKFPFIYYDL